MSRATEMTHRCLGQQRGVPWPHVPSQECEDQLAEEQPCGKAEMAWEQRWLTAVWAGLREVVIPLYFALIRPHLDVVPSLGPPSTRRH